MSNLSFCCLVESECNPTHYANLSQCHDSGALADGGGVIMWRMLLFSHYNGTVSALFKKLLLVMCIPLYILLII